MITFQIITFNSDPILEQVIRSLQLWGWIVVVEGPVKFWQEKGYTTSTDRTNEILHDLLPEQDIIHGQWNEKDEMMNAALSRITPDTRFVWMVDSDEVLPQSSMAYLCNEILPDGVIDSVSFNWNSFYGGFDRVLTGFEAEFENHRIQRWYEGARWHTHRPPTVLDPKKLKPWRETGVHINATEAFGFPLFHYSYVFPFQVRAKTRYYHSWTQTIPDYFENVYLPWVTGDGADKERIEAQYQGVHDWLPARRGPCYTKPFGGRHPAIIEEAMPDLKKRFARELIEVQL